ncbi:MAG: 50S ribosomal protein L35ae [Candidatus Nanoarchaeia archaeon]
MKGVIINFRGGLHTQRNTHMIVKVDSVKSKSDAEKLMGKKVVWVSPAGKEIAGKVVKPHGNKGALRVIFDKGMPGQAVGKEVKVE